MSPTLQLLTAFLLGGVLCFVIGWLWGSRRRDSIPLANSADATPLESELRDQLARRDSDLVQLRTQLADTGNARASAEARQGATEKLLVEQRALQEKALLDLREAFKALSADALKQ